MDSVKKVYIHSALLVIFGGVLTIDLLRQWRELKKMKKDLKMLENLPNLNLERPSKLMVDEIDIGPLQKIKMRYQQSIHKICITGGPRSGKTTAVSTIREVLVDKGFNVYLIPNNEHLTMEPQNYVPPFQGKHLNYDHRLCIAKLKLKIALDIYDYFILLSQLSDRPTVLLSDGSVLDQDIEIAADIWDDLQEMDSSINITHLRNTMYDAVIHLVTNAEGKQDSDIHKVLSDIIINSQKQQIIKDQRIQEFWTGHQRHIIVNNQEKDFKKKIENAVQHVQKLVGLPVTHNLWKKFLINQVQFPMKQHKVTIIMTDIFLTKTTEYEDEKVRSRECNGVTQYQHIIRSNNLKSSFSSTSTSFHETKRPISASEFMQLRKRKDPQVNELQRERISFIYQNQPYLLDCIQFDNYKIGILKVEIPTNGQLKELPSFLDITKEITSDPHYSSISLASRQKQQS